MRCSSGAVRLGGFVKYRVGSVCLVPDMDLPCARQALSSVGDGAILDLWGVGSVSNEILHALICRSSAEPYVI